jgi:predicted small metal-binding protein
MSNQEIVFVVESCQNCGAGCGWHTRHDEAKYTEFFKRIAAAIIDRIPNAMIMKN